EELAPEDVEECHGVFDPMPAGRNRDLIPHGAAPPCAPGARRPGQQGRTGPGRLPAPRSGDRRPAPGAGPGALPRFVPSGPCRTLPLSRSRTRPGASSLILPPVRSPAVEQLGLVRVVAPTP